MFMISGLPLAKKYNLPILKVILCKFHIVLFINNVNSSLHTAELLRNKFKLNNIIICFMYVFFREAYWIFLLSKGRTIYKGLLFGITAVGCKADICYLLLLPGELKISLELYLEMAEVRDTENIIFSASGASAVSPFCSTWIKVARRN